MNRVIFLSLLVFGFAFGQQKQVMVKKYKMSDTESVKDVDVEVDDKEITIKLNIDGEEKVFKANPENEEEMTALKEMLAEMDVKVNMFDGGGDHAMKFMHKSGGYLGVHI